MRIVSYLAPNWFWLYSAIAAFWERSLHLETQIVQSPVDPLEDALLLQGQIEIAFICGLPFVRHPSTAQLQVLAAPVMQASRYQSRPVYFSDVIVHAASAVTMFDQLAGKTFCYNDRGSNSGYNLMRYRLMQGGYPADWLGQTVASGSHQQSVQWVAQGRAEVAAIDSIVLEQAWQDQPELQTQLRVIESIGPCPVPPIVAAKHLGAKMLQQLQTALLHPDSELQQQMQQAGIQRFAAVDRSDYESIAQMYSSVMQAGYETIGRFD